ncbi:thioredoxin family protein [Granulicella mallensis]|uniref:Thioredoxin domain-containing protein n=1 Tax=Granulicella mallensis (strain ATCC BAA-1857 / DSM 23137 / MP5ACTX8) TaxID=682795 RepID=G8NV98_GRAMM|nr:thioredoxin family protein [Granulicella mallensis]AEU35387.1 Thioredoxin domain-containing protein [Granulicella mallensis MP5ACTX8]
MAAKSVLLSGTRKAFGAVVLAALLSTGGMVTATAHAQMSAKHIYPTIEAAPADIKAALAEARRTHRRVLIDFGGDWCGDCQLLNLYFDQSPNADLLAKNFVRVNINIGHIDANLDIGDRYGVTLRKGTPALAVLDGQGHVLYAQKIGEFEHRRNMEPSEVTAFLEKWKR